MNKLILVSQDYGGLGLMTLAKSQGSDVIAAFDYAQIEEEDLPGVKLIGDGMIEKIPLKQATQSLIRQGNLWVFDSNDLWKASERLRAAGEAVIGTSELSHQLEEDRDFALAAAEEVGIAVPPSEKFTDHEKGIKFLEANPEKAYVYKPDGEDPTATFVPSSRDEPQLANEELRDYIGGLTSAKASFILQEVVDGIEANFEIWVQEGKPIAAFCDLESKRKATGDLGGLIGCAGGVVFRVSPQSRGVKVTAGRYLGWPKIKGYTGSIDANVIFKDGKPFFLENCFRFGFNAYPAIFLGLIKRSVEETLRGWAHREDSLAGAFKNGFASSLTLTSDAPTTGFPILAPKEMVPEHLYLYRAYDHEGKVCMTEGWGEIACTVAHGATPESAAKAALAVADEVSFPGISYRLDLMDSDDKFLPIYRHRALASRGLLS